MSLARASGVDRLAARLDELAEQCGGVLRLQHSKPERTAGCQAAKRRSCCVRFRDEVLPFGQEEQRVLGT
jgi:hypothetical protein